jgi:hypothetical protein
MPTLKLMSVYRARKQAYADQLAGARAELERFKADIVTRFGKETADAVKMQTHWTEDMAFGRVEVPRLTQEGYAAVETLQLLTRKLVAVRRRLRTPRCWFRENPEPISVLETVGLSWKEVEEKYVENEHLSLSGVLELLRVLNTTAQTLPTDQQVWQWAAEGLSPCHLPHEWRRVLQGRKGRLLLLLLTAANLEEDLRYGR